ncbi:MAG: hypothetical protein ACXWCY_05790 [Burkholderiales bacterium]
MRLRLERALVVMSKAPSPQHAIVALHTNVTATAQNKNGPPKDAALAGDATATLDLFCRAWHHFMDRWAEHRKAQGKDKP